MGKRIVYTEAASKSLEQLQTKFAKQIEIYMQEKKYVPGDDVIEITSTDIDEIAYRYEIVLPKRTNIRAILPITYFIAGIIVVFIGLFYNDILNLLTGDPKRLILIIIGVAMLIMSGLYFYLNKIIYKKEKAERIYYEEERRRKLMK